MGDYHQLRLTASPGGLLFECEQGCGRRLVVDRDGALTVIDRGEPSALHRGASDDVDLATPGVIGPAGPT
jgi:hypothetical protein